MTDIELAWCAGLFEGEGSIYRCNQIRHDRKDKKYTYNRMCLRMTDKDVIEKFFTLVDCGTVSEQSNRLCKRLGRKKVYTWQLTPKDKIIKLCELFWPYLMSRRKGKIIELGICHSDGTGIHD